MDDPVESDAARPAPDEALTRPGGDAGATAGARPGPDAPAGAGGARPDADAPAATGDAPGFRLRIGGTDRPRLGTLGADPARPVTGEVPATGGATAAAGPAASATPVTGEVPATQADEWDVIPEAVRQDEAREYRTDLDVQRFIADLANQIAASDGSPTPSADVAARSRTTATPPLPTRVPSKAAAVKTGADRPGADRTGADRPGAATKHAAKHAVAERAPAAVAVATADAPVSEAAAPTVEDGRVAALPAAEVAVAVAVPSIVEATPSAQVTGQQPVVAPVLVPVAPAPAPVAAPVLPVAQLLPRIEATPGAPRPTKPVDFRSLLGDAGLQAPGTPKRKKKQRHPFRFLVKALLLLGLLGGGAYAAKRYYLDSRWASDVEGIADDVADRRGLAWDDAVDVVVLAPNDYALRLATTMLGVDIAQAATLGAEWRAMGLAEGSLDLVAVGSAAMADRPAFYDPVDATVYQVDGLSDEVREIALSRALASALLDQHFHWGDAIATASPSVRLGILALFDGDAMAVETSTVAAVLADETLATKATAELAGLRLEAAPLASGAPPYAVALTGLAGVVTAPQFSGDLALNPVGRNAVVDLAVTSDAAIFDGARGRSAAVELPAQATTTVAPGDATSGTAASAGTASIGVIGDASGAASQTEQAIQETMGAAAESAGTILDAAATTVAGDPSASTPAAPPTTEPTAAATATTRGLVYWYYVLAGRLDPGRAWSAALQWQGDLTSVGVSAEGLCVSSIVTTADAAGRDVLLGALQEWAAGAPVGAATTVAAAGDTEITVHSCDPGPSADTSVNAQVPLFGNADEEQIVAFGLLDEGLPRSEAARACVFRAVREIGLPALLESKTLDRSLTQRTLDPTAPQIDALIARCGNE